MSIHSQNCRALTWSATDTTVGACGVISIIAAGSAALSTLTLLDGTAIKVVLPVQITAGALITFSQPLAFQNLITDMTGTAGYTVAFVSRP